MKKVKYYEDEKYCDIIVNRIINHKKQLELF